jgi:hypothetical protein
MAVLESQSNALNTCSSTRPYGCSGRVFKDGYYLRVREYLTDGTYAYQNKFIEHTMSKECRYDHSLTDQRCQFCNHRGSGERYDQMIRSKGK